MVDILVYRTFEYVNDAPASGVPVKVVTRGSDSPFLKELTTDTVGAVSFYIPSGNYDYLVMGSRVPFDVLPGGGGYVPFKHHQSTPSASWSVVHNLGTKPPVMVVLDSEPTVPCYADVDYIDENQLTITLDSAESGWAYL